jgi:hypothetical protein
LLYHYLYCFGRNKYCLPGHSVDGVATLYGLEVSGLENREGEDFRTCPESQGAYTTSCKTSTHSISPA